MGYGGSRQDAGRAIGKSGDGGIDGIIKEDKLGLDAIYVQAKRWEGSVGRPEIQKFAGALRSYCIEAMMQNGLALQAGTSHDLGQNFGKTFDVQFQSKEGQLDYVWQTSWGVSTRLMGGLIMSHSDDKGLVLPPKLAPNKAVLVPIFRKDEERAAVLEAAHKIAKEVGAILWVDHWQEGA